jgi:type VI protein secretion system component Hcp
VAAFAPFGEGVAVVAIDVFLYLYKGDAVVKGGSTDAVFPNAIALKSFSMDAEATIDLDEQAAQQMESRVDHLQMPFGGEQAKPEKPLDSFSIEISKEFDRSSTELFKNYALVAQNPSNPDKVRFAKAEVYCRIAGPSIQPGMKPEQLCFLVYEFRNLHIYEYSLEIGEESSIPTEKCKFYFDKYRITYRQQMRTGKLGTPLSLGWDFEREAAF